MSRYNDNTIQVNYLLERQTQLQSSSYKNFRDLMQRKHPIHNNPKRPLQVLICWRRWFTWRQEVIMKRGSIQNHKFSSLRKHNQVRWQLWSLLQKCRKQIVKVESSRTERSIEDFPKVQVVGLKNCKKKTHIIILHPYQKRDVNFMRVEAALRTNPEKGCDDKCKINMQTVWATRWPVITRAWVFGPGWTFR